MERDRIVFPGFVARRYFGVKGSRMMVDTGFLLYRTGLGWANLMTGDVDARTRAVDGYW